MLIKLTSKHEIRKSILQLRNTLKVEDTLFASNAALPILLDLFSKIEKKSNKKLNIMSYMSFKNEFPTSKINRLITELGHTLILPVTDHDFAIKAYEVDSEDTMKISYLGIPEPDPLKCTPFSPEKIDIILMPGVAFDTKGNRIGFGKGCYDRFIAGIKNRPVLAALAYDFQIIDNIPSDPLDIPCNYVITEKGIINVL